MQQCDKMRELSLPFCPISNNNLRCLQKKSSAIGIYLLSQLCQIIFLPAENGHLVIDLILEVCNLDCGGGSHVPLFALLILSLLTKKLPQFEGGVFCL